MKIINQISVVIFFITSYAFAQAPQWRVYRTNNSGLPSNYINCVAIDSNNVKWIGTDNGLVKLEGNTMTVYDTSNSGIPDNNVRRIAIDSQNVIWIGTHDKGLGKFDGMNWQTYDTINSGIASNRIRDIQISQDIKWIGTGNRGLVKFDNTNFTTYNVTNSGIADNYIISIRLENNIKWLGSYAFNGGITRLSDTGVVIYRNTNSGLPTNLVTSIDMDNLNNLWIATDFAGLAKFNYVTNTWIIYNQSNSEIPDNNLLTVTTQNKLKWVGTLGAGLAKFDDTSWVVYNPDNSPIPSITVHKIEPDVLDNVWIATTGGLAVFNPNGIVSVENQEQIIPNSFTLYQNYPNPFNPTTHIHYDLNKPALVELKIYNSIGVEIYTLANGYQQPKYHEVVFYAEDKISSGVYYYVLKIDGLFADSKKFVYLK